MMTKKQLEEEIEDRERVLIKYRVEIAEGSSNDCTLSAMEWAQWAEVSCLLTIYDKYYANQKMSDKSKLIREIHKLQKQIRTIEKTPYKDYSDFHKIDLLDTQIETLQQKLKEYIKKNKVDGMISN